MMTLDSIQTRLHALLTEIIGNNNTALDMPLFRGGIELDSMSAAAFITAIEQEYSIELAEEDLELTCLYSLRTVSRFVATNLSRHRSA